MTYSSVFGGTSIYPSDVSLLAIALTADVTLEWPLESSGTLYPAARIIDVTPSANGYSVVMPDATLTGAGQIVLFNNLSGSHSFIVKDAAGGTLATIAFGEQWELYLSDTSTAAGTWRVFRFGASTATVQPSALAGYGLTTTSNTLSQSMPISSKNSSPYTILSTDRARFILWEGTGAGTFTLPSPASVGNNFFVAVRDSGGGDLTIAPSAGETIDDAATLVLAPGDSTTIATDGVNWYTMGLGQDATFVFDYTSIDLAGQPTPYNLSGSELNRVAYDFIGVLTASVEVVVPSTVQQYWVSNDTTGAFTISLRTSTQVTGVTIPQGYSAILYCNGSSVILASASTATLPTVVGVSQGGTGQSTYTVGDILYASAALTLSKLNDIAVGNVLLSGGVATAPAWGKVTLTAHVSGVLPVVNGGTGTTTSTGTGDVVLATGPTMTLINATGLPLATGVTGTLPVGSGGTGQTTYVDGQLLIGNTTGNTLTKATLTAGGSIAITNGGGSITIAVSAPAAGVVTSNGTTLGSVAAPAGTIVGTTDAQTLSNKRITPRANIAATTGSPWAINSDSYDEQGFTALANALTISADAGTPGDGQKMLLRFKDNSSARVLTFTGGSAKSFRPVGAPLTVSGSNFTYTTTAGKTVYFGCIYNSDAARWDVAAFAVES